MWKRILRHGDPPERPSLFGLAPSGVCPATDITARAVRSYRTISPLPAAKATGGMFSVALSLRSPPPDVIRHSVSMEPGLSSIDCGEPQPTAAIRPSGQGTMVPRRYGVKRQRMSGLRWQKSGRRFLDQARRQCAPAGSGAGKQRPHLQVHDRRTARQRPVLGTAATRNR